MECLFALSTECIESLFLRGSLWKYLSVRVSSMFHVRVGVVQSSTEGSSLITTIKRFRAESSQQFEVLELY